ncbi:MAG TPA: DUF3291 domain-containing protein [Dehalococcoidia bacterium]|nr:DUF3291 domain-containing protein [Dehalococcoidia bacterium]
MTTGRGWHVAQYNIARLVAPLDDPRIADFVAALDRVNALGDTSAGFVWRLQTEDGTSTSVRVRGDDRILVNFTAWESVEALFQFTYHSGHAEIFRRRREWFEQPAEAYLVLWWVPAGHIPSVAEADERLDHLRAHGPTERAFTFKQRFGAPIGLPAPAERL